MAKRILIVDDEPDICEILRFNLEMEGYEVLTAEGAEEAQRIVDSYLSNGNSIDLILLDVMMTPKSGFEWARELKSDTRTVGVPIIFCTAKTLEEDWSYTQFDLPSDHPDYRTEDFKLYTAWSTEADIMYRYARRWASGVGIDLFHGSYASRIEEVDKANKHDDKHSPWSVGLAAKHEAYFHNLALHVSLGAYLYREMGYRAKFIEKRYYETVGLRYAFPSLANLAVGFKVKAHYLKADYTELNIAMPIVLGK